MVRALFEIWGGALSHGYGVTNFTGYCSDVRVARTSIHQQVISAKDPQIDYVIWIDDDNPVLWAHLEMLIGDLEVLPRFSAVAGWTLIQPDLLEGLQQIPPRSSVGMMNGKQWESVSLDLLRDAGGLMAVDMSGFPLLAMKFETAVLLGKFPFQPYVSDEFPWGQTGEDVSFCLRLKELGGQLFVDPRVEVPHLKVRPVMEIRTADARPEQLAVSAGI